MEVAENWGGDECPDWLRMSVLEIDVVPYALVLGRGGGGQRWRKESVLETDARAACSALSVGW